MQAKYGTLNFDLILFVDSGRRTGSLQRESAMSLLRMGSCLCSLCWLLAISSTKNSRALRRVQQSQETSINPASS